MTLSFLERYDREFYARCVDPELRHAEIARLRRHRATLFVVVVFMFLLVAARAIFLHKSDSFLWLLVFVELFAFYEVQFRLRLLLLSEQWSHRKTLESEGDVVTESDFRD